MMTFDCGVETCPLHGKARVEIGKDLVTGVFTSMQIGEVKYQVVHGRWAITVHGRGISLPEGINKTLCSFGRPEDVVLTQDQIEVILRAFLASYLPSPLCTLTTGRS